MSRLVSTVARLYRLAVPPLPAMSRLAVALVALLAAPAAVAQAPSRTVWIASGPVEHDAVYTRAAAVGARVDARLLRFVLAEVGVFYAPLGQASPRATSLLLPDAQVQFEIPLGAVRPYVGAGVGAHVALASTARCVSVGEESPEVACRPDDRFNAALAVELGARMDLGGRLRARLGGRVLKAETFGDGGNVLSLAAGVGYGF